MIDTKAEREYAEAIYKYTSRCDEAAKHIDRLSYEVDLLCKQNWQARQKIGTLEQEVDRLKLDVDWLQTPMRKRHEALLAAAKVVQHGDSDSGKTYKRLREAIAACEEENHRKHIDLCRKQVVELLEAKTKEVGHEDE